MNYYDEIKNILISNEAYKKVKDYYKNRNDLMSYYNVGKLLYEAGNTYGESIIKKYSKSLTTDLGKGYSWRNLYNMRKFYLFFKDNSNILQPLAAKLTWTNLSLILVMNDNSKIHYYINKCINYNLSKRKLIESIKSKEYERLSNETKNKLINNNEVNLEDNILNPIIINTFNKDVNKFNEKILKEFILNDIDNFLRQLGNGYSYIGNEYPILLGDRYNYIDLLLFNINFNCYVCIELKVTELKKEHIGQIETYMHYIDSNIKSLYQNNTIGIIICKKDNKFVMESIITYLYFCFKDFTLIIVLRFTYSL